MTSMTEYETASLELVQRMAARLDSIAADVSWLRRREERKQQALSETLDQALGAMQRFPSR